MSLTGKWSGYYEYGLGYSLPEFGERVDFQLDITEIDGTIHGKIEEGSSSLAVKEESRIEGFHRQ